LLGEPQPSDRRVDPQDPGDLQLAFATIGNHGVIGEVLGAFDELPMSVQQNTVIVFMSDHGEYAGAHGFLSGKVGTGAAPTAELH
jgi:hypothetical protein